MKHYMDIENLREFDVDLGNGIKRMSNCGAFEVGDLITISEKIDGSNFSVTKNAEDGELVAFSRKQQLGPMQTLNGAWNYAMTLNKDAFSPRYIVFGEWTGQKNKIVYDKEKTGIWYVFDIYDARNEKYLPWSVVKEWCDKWGFEYAKINYFGKFVSWDHCRTFMKDSAYGQTKEGIVVKNQSKIGDDRVRLPIYLKLVNESFQESMKIRAPKEVDPEKEAAKAKAESYAEQIVTRNRVEKMLTKLRDEGILGNEIRPEDMKVIAKNLPKRIFDDCMKEEREIVEAMGEYAGKAISAATMKLAREIVL